MEGRLALPALTLGTTYPCCGKVARFRAVDRVPRERYERVCLACDTRWTVTHTYHGDRDGVRLDLLDWADASPAVR
jgi:hypothetical protein